ncbi:MAG: tRNA(Met) cytidine acetyltransferase TmcA [Halobacteriaceae archaeon]
MSRATAIGLANSLLAEATRADERRALALRGRRQNGLAVADALLESTALSPDAVTLVGSARELACEEVAPRSADRLLGTTRQGVILDWHESCRPNALGQAAGTVEGGGLLIALLPPAEDWPASACAFHDSLAVPPATTDEVETHYHDRVEALLEAHRGIAVFDVDASEVVCDGLTDPPPARARSTPEAPNRAAFPTAAYTSCLTHDQAEAVATLEALRESGGTAILEAARGRGKSSAAGLAAASLTLDGADVIVTAPRRPGTAPLFDRAADLLASLDRLAGREPWRVETRDGGSLEFRPVREAVAQAADTDVFIVDEAAGLPVRRLEALLAADRIAFVTTVHGYEGAGRGFDVRFRERLAETDRAVRELQLSEPIRYARGDPIETWVNRTLLLDARPPVAQLVEDATAAEATYRALGADALLEDEHRLRAVFGLLVLAHYRTEPNDLARLLDAPNVRVRVLTDDGAVVSVALLAAEGGLSEATRMAMYDGDRVRGNMLPDIFASQLRDPEAARPRGHRVLRIATHQSVRSRGLGSRLLEAIRTEAESDAAGGLAGADWLGVGYGATPELLRFWARNGYRTVHLSTTRNETSGEYSAVMLAPLSAAGDAIQTRLGSWFVERVGAVLGDALVDLDPDVVRAALRATAVRPELALSDRDWRLIAGAGYGPGLYDVDPRPFATLAVYHLTDPGQQTILSERQERLLVAKALQAKAWADVADELDYHSRGECMRAVGDAYATLADHYGNEVTAAERARYEE